MRVCIHRGANEIGGNCIEIESHGRRIVLDVGRPLSATYDEHVPLPRIAGFYEPDPELLGVFVSHGHQDHWGLAEQLPEATPVFAGKATVDILREAAFFTRGLKLEPAGFLEHERTFTLGPFEITPYLMDHSAFDTYALLISAHGKRVFYSADFRMQGAKAKLVGRLIENPPADVDVLLLEGTRLPVVGEPDGSERTERELAAEVAQIISGTAGMVLVSYSAQNIDRMVQLYRAAKACDRQFVMDLYTASIAKATGNEKIPHAGADWPLVRVYVPLWQRIKVKEAEEYERVGGDIKAARIFEGELAREPGRFVTKLSGQTLKAIAKHGDLSGSHAIWSLWSGYLNEPSGKALVTDLEKHGIPLSQVHVSGHASVSTLQSLAKAIAPQRLVPIHSEGAERFPQYFSNVEFHADGEWWEV